MNLEQLQYPIGQFECPQVITRNELDEWTDTLSEFPEDVAYLLQQTEAHQLEWPYRPEGWTLRQVVHHCADSHMNCLIRFKLALTEHKPTIRPYLEAQWAELVDAEEQDLSYSQMLLDGVHHKLTLLLKNMTDSDFEKSYYHPEVGESFSLKKALGLYAWHCKHHLAHMQQALDSEGRYV